MEKYKAISLFAGVGGIDIGFEQTKKVEVIWANEFDQNAAITYRANHKNELSIEDVHNVKKIEVDGKTIKEVDIVLAGFPCQAFSVAGYRKGFEDTRGDLFFETLRIAKSLKPKVIFLENVKNLKNHDKGKTYKVIKESLEKNGFYVYEMILNSKEYGDVPQNRERIYIIAFKDERAYKRYIPPTPLKLTKKLYQVVDFKTEKEDKYYYKEGQCDFYDLLKESITSQDTIYQWRRQYVRENKNGVCPTLTANMGTGGHNVPLIYTDSGIRKLTPEECFKLQGFPSSFKLPIMANSHLYKQAGNSVVVPVIRRVAESILSAL